MAKRNTKIATDPNDIEVYPTVAGFEVAFRKAEVLEGRQLFEIVLRSRTDATRREQLLLTSKRHWCSRRVMDFHAAACAMQRMHGVQRDRAA